MSLIKSNNTNFLLNCFSDHDDYHAIIFPKWHHLVVASIKISISCCVMKGTGLTWCCSKVAVLKYLLPFFFFTAGDCNKLQPERSFKLASLPDILSNLFWGVSADFFFLYCHLGACWHSLNKSLKHFLPRDGWRWWNS